MKYVTTLLFFGLLPLGAQAAPSLAEQAAKALEAQPAPPETQFDWKRALDTPKPTAPDAPDTPVSTDAGPEAPQPLEETPAQRYYRLVEEYRLNHKPPRDTLGAILKRHEDRPWPPRKAK